MGAMLDASYFRPLVAWLVTRISLWPLDQTTTTYLQRVWLTRQLGTQTRTWMANLIQHDDHSCYDRARKEVAFSSFHAKKFQSGSWVLATDDAPRSINSYLASCRRKA